MCRLPLNFVSNFYLAIILFNCSSNYSLWRFISSLLTGQALFDDDLAHFIALVLVCMFLRVAATLLQLLVLGRTGLVLALRTGLVLAETGQDGTCYCRDRTCSCRDRTRLVLAETGRGLFLQRQDGTCSCRDRTCSSIFSWAGQDFRVLSQLHIACSFALVFAYWYPLRYYTK